MVTTKWPGAMRARLLSTVGRIARDAKPEHVDRRADVLDRAARPLRARSNGGRRSRSCSRRGSRTRPRAKRPRTPTTRPARLDQSGDLGAHAQRERGQLLRLGGEEVEELPLRHQRDERVARRQAAEIAELDVPIAEPAADHVEALVRALQEGVEQAELVHDAQRRRMDRVAAEVAQEVAVLLEHHGANAGAGEQVAEHHAGRAAADDAALRRRRVEAASDPRCCSRSSRLSASVNRARKASTPCQCASAPAALRSARSVDEPCVARALPANCVLVAAANRVQDRRSSAPALPRSRPGRCRPARSASPPPRATARSSPRYSPGEKAITAATSPGCAAASTNTSAAE